MPADPAEREKLIVALFDAERESSTWTVMLHQAVAEQVGLNITDHKCLDILNTRGSMTAGQLAQITGLTTGAVTGVIDRLEKAGYAHRERDLHDRRRVIVQPNGASAPKDLDRIFAHFIERMHPLLENFSEAELALLVRYLREGVEAMQSEVTWLRALDPAEG
jgi:DNA-binding MarR family transcriptional regulator